MQRLTNNLHTFFTVIVRFGKHPSGAVDDSPTGVPDEKMILSMFTVLYYQIKSLLHLQHKFLKGCVQRLANNLHTFSTVIVRFQAAYHNSLALCFKIA